MIIGFIWDGNYPWDIRVNKICTSLVAAGHEVHMICRNTRREKLEDTSEGIQLHRLPCLPNFFGPLNQLINFPFFFNPVWLWRINSVVNKKRIDALIVRDITLSLPAIWIGRTQRIPVFLDMAEPYPEMLRAMWKYEKMKLTDLLIRNPRFADWVERLTLRDIDHVFAMVEESKQRMVGMGVPESKITIVSNTPNLDRFRKFPAEFPGSLAGMKTNFKIIYIGYLTGSRGLQTAIKGMCLVLKSNPQVRLVIVGSGKSENELRNLVQKNHLDHAVVFEGWVDNNKLPTYVSSCEVGLIPHYSCGLWDNTIPNKLFDYMATATPVLCSDVPPMRRIVEETGCGRVYNNVSPEDFSKKVLELASSPHGLLRMGAQGEEAVKKKYNWQVDFNSLLHVIENIGSSS